MEWTTEGLLPLSNFQKEVLIDTVNVLQQDRICYRDIIEIFRWIGVDIYTKKELISLILKGGNVFLNHLIFCLIHTREWSEESRQVLHVQDFALKLNSCFNPQLFRYVWIGVRQDLRIKTLHVLTRGKGWYANPLDARDAGLASRSNIPIPFYVSCSTPILMLESSCPCMIFIEEKDTFNACINTCNCGKIWSRNKNFFTICPSPSPAASCNENEIGYDEIDANTCLDYDEGYTSMDESLDCSKDSSHNDEFVVIDGIKISRHMETENNDSKYGYLIEHSNTHFSSNHKDILSAYKNYLLS